MSVTTIDVSQLNQETADALLHAAKTTGFLKVSNHGISKDLIDRTFAVSKRFFTASKSDKEGANGEFIINKDNVGYTATGSEKLDQINGDVKEAYNLTPQCALPPLLQDPVLRDFDAACKLLSLRILQLFAMGVHLERDYFASKHGEWARSGSVLRLLRYSSEGNAGQHTDYGSLTLLFTSQPGLEIQSSSASGDEEWSAVEPDDSAVVVNVADQLSLWTGGTLRSTVHRVRPTHLGERYSIAFFCHPDDETLLDSVPGLGRSSVDGVTAGDHLRRRLQATYT